MPETICIHVNSQLKNHVGVFPKPFEIFFIPSVDVSKVIFVERVHIPVEGFKTDGVVLLSSQPRFGFYPRYIVSVLITQS